MKRTFILVVAGALALSSLGSVANAAVKQRNPIKGPTVTSARPTVLSKVHDVGNMWTTVFNNGVYGDPNSGDTGNPSGEWPAGSGVYYIWEGRFWIGARVGGQPLVSHADYGNYELFPSDGSTYYFGNGPKAIQDGLVEYDDLDASIGGHTPIGFQMTQRSLAWSLPDYDDFQAFYMEIKNVSGGVLNNVFVTWVYDNDVGSGPNGATHGNGGAIEDLADYEGWAPEGQNPWRYDWVDPMDLDGDGDTGYDVWGRPKADPYNPYWNGYTDDNVPADDNPEPDGFYDEWQIFLDENGPVLQFQTDVTINDVDYVAGDPAVDSKGNVLHGYAFPRNTSYMYDGDDPSTPDNDEGERDLSTPADGFIGTRLIYQPRDPFNSAPEDTFPRPYSHQWWNWESDPGSDQEKYEYMEGRHTLSAGQNFMVMPFDYGAGAPVFDYRYLQAIGPFSNWANNEVKKFVMVTGVGKGLQGMRENLDNAMIAYYSGQNGDPEAPEAGDIGTPASTYPYDDAVALYGNQLGFTGASNAAVANDGHFILPIPPPIPTLNYSAEDRGVTLVWDSSAETAIDSFIGSVDFSGYKIYRSKYTTADWEMIAAFDLSADAVYLLNTERDTLNPIIDSNGDTLTATEDGYADAKAAGGYAYIMVDLPGSDLSNIPHQYKDGAVTFEDNEGNVIARYVDGYGTFYDRTGVPIFRHVEQPINGLNYYYTVVAFDPDKGALQSIESSRSNYRKTLAGGADPVIPRAAAAPDGVLDEIRVVPNPYKGTALFESRYQDRISFINLPPRCKISIFSLTGDLIDEIYKNNAQSGQVNWDLISRNEQSVVSGLYIYTVETPGGEKKIGKFLIIR